MKNKITELELQKMRKFEQDIRSVLPNNVSGEIHLEDFLVDASDIEKVKEVLLKNGFFD